MIIKLKPGIKTGELLLLRRKPTQLLPGSDFVSGKGFFRLSHSLKEFYFEITLGIDKC